MSKKNKLKTRQNAHQFDLDREKAVRKSQKSKEGKRVLPRAGGSTAKAAPKVSRLVRKRLVRGTVVKGIKITDSDSKKRVRKLLIREAQAAMDTT